MVQKQAPSRTFGLYLDMNGIIHPCTHGDDDGSKKAPPPKQKKSTKKEDGDEEDVAGGSQEEAASDEETPQTILSSGSPTPAIARLAQPDQPHPLATNWRNVLTHLRPTFAAWDVPVEGLSEVAADEDAFVAYDTLTKVSQVCLAVNFLVMAARPQRILYMAMDGVAPRAKMVQQRSRRYMAAAEKHGGSVAVGEDDAAGDDPSSPLDGDDESAELQQLKAGSLYGIPSEGGVRSPSAASPTTEPPSVVLTPEFDSNCISPGTLFMTRCAEGLETHIKTMLELAEIHALATEKAIADGVDAACVGAPEGVPEALWNGAPYWRGLTVVLSDTNTPGEGEHKIVDFIRAQQVTIEREQQALLAVECAKTQKAEQLLLPHTPPPPPVKFSPPCHVIMAKDADLILLCLGLHLPNTVIMRDEFRLGAFSMSSGWPVVFNRELVPEELFFRALKQHQARQLALVKASEGVEGRPKDMSDVTTKIKKSKPMFDYYNINTLGRCIMSEVYAITKRAHPVLRDAMEFDDTCRGAFEKLVEIERRTLQPLAADVNGQRSAKKGSGRSSGGSTGDERMAILIDAAVQCFQNSASAYSTKSVEEVAMADPTKPVPIAFDTTRFAAARRRPLSEAEAHTIASVAMLVAAGDAAIDPRDGIVKRKLKAKKGGGAADGWGTVLSNPCTVPTHNKAIINDYITMATLLGNDFMPRLPSGFCGDFAMDNLVEAYVHCVLPYGYLTDVSSLPTIDSTTADPLAAYIHRSKDPAEIRLDQLYRLLEGYAKVEISQLRQQCFNNGKYGPEVSEESGVVVAIDELNRVQQDRVLFDPVVDGVWWTPYYKTTSIVGSTSRYNMIECYKSASFFEPKNLSSNASSPTTVDSAASPDPVNKDVRKVLDHACHWYLDGIQFVFQYYVTNSTLPANINLETTPASDVVAQKTSDWQQQAAGRYWAWCFPYHHAPFAIDIVAYLRGVLQLDADGIPSATAPKYLSDVFTGRGAATIEAISTKKVDGITDTTVIIPTPFTQLLAILPPTSASLLPPPLAQLMLKDVIRGHPEGGSVASTLAAATSHHGVASSLSCTFPARWGIDYTVADGGKEHLATVLLPFADVDFLASCVAGVFAEGSAGTSNIALSASDRARNINKMYTQVYEVVGRGSAGDNSSSVVSPTFGAYVQHVKSWEMVSGCNNCVAKFDYPELTARAGVAGKSTPAIGVDASAAAPVEVNAAVVRREYAYIYDGYPSPLELQELAVVEYDTAAVRLHTDELLGSAPWAGPKKRRYNNNRRGGGQIRDASGGFLAATVFGFGNDFNIESKERFPIVRRALNAIRNVLPTNRIAFVRHSPLAATSTSALGLAPLQDQAGLRPIISSTSDMWALAARRLGATTPNVPFAVSTGSSCDPLGLLSARKVEIPAPNFQVLQPAVLSLGDAWLIVVALVSLTLAFVALVVGPNEAGLAGDANGSGFGGWGFVGSIVIPTSIRYAVDVVLVGFFVALTGLGLMLVFAGTGNNLPVKESLIRRNTCNHRVFAPRVDWVCAGTPSALSVLKPGQVGAYAPAAVSGVSSSTIAPSTVWVHSALSSSSSSTSPNTSLLSKIKGLVVPSPPAAHVGGCLATNYGRNETCFVCGAPCEEGDGGAWALLSSKMKPDRDHLNTNHGGYLEEVFLCLPSLHTNLEIDSEGANAMDHEAAMAMLRRAGVIATPLSPASGAVEEEEGSDGDVGMM